MTEVNAGRATPVGDIRIAIEMGKGANRIEFETVEMAATMRKERKIITMTGKIEEIRNEGRSEKRAEFQTEDSTSGVAMGETKHDESERHHAADRKRDARVEERK
jgi:hypothetical protein